jgi:hypothetical protein
MVYNATTSQVSTQESTIIKPVQVFYKLLSKFIREFLGRKRGGLLPKLPCFITR